MVFSNRHCYEILLPTTAFAIFIVLGIRLTSPWKYNRYPVYCHWPFKYPPNPIWNPFPVCGWILVAGH